VTTFTLASPAQFKALTSPARSGPRNPLPPLGKTWRGWTSPRVHEVVKAVTADGQWLFERAADGTWSVGHLPSKTVVKHGRRSLGSCRSYTGSGRAVRDFKRIQAGETAREEGWQMDSSISGLRMTLGQADQWLERQDWEHNSPLRRSILLAEVKGKGRVREPARGMFITIFYADGLYHAHVREGVSVINPDDSASPLIVDCSCGWSTEIPATRDEYGDAQRAHFAHVEASKP
jgi:hypothetical protein